MKTKILVTKYRVALLLTELIYPGELKASEAKIRDSLRHADILGMAIKVVKLDEEEDFVC